MPISKPVKKQKIILPSPRDFYHMPLGTKEMILRRLSTDNLIIYMDLLIRGRTNPRDALNHVTVEQIVDEDDQLESGGSALGGGIGAYIAIQDWVAKNETQLRANAGGSGGGGSGNGSNGGNGGFDLESQLNSGTPPLIMHNTKAINQALLSSSLAVPIMKLPSGPDLRRSGGSGGSLPQNHPFNLSALGATLPTSPSDSLYFSITKNQCGTRCGNEVTAAAGNYSQLRRIWDGLPVNNSSNSSNSSGGSGGDPGAANRIWQNNKQTASAGASTQNTGSTCSSSNTNLQKAKNNDSSSKSIVAGVEEMLQMQAPLEPDFLRVHNLPTPEAFNELSEQEGARLLASLPRNLRNKYEYHCWSCKLNQLIAKRPQLDDDGQEKEEGGNGGDRPADNLS